MTQSERDFRKRMAGAQAIGFLSGMLLSTPNLATEIALSPIHRKRAAEIVAEWEAADALAEEPTP